MRRAEEKNEWEKGRVGDLILIAPSPPLTLSPPNVSFRNVTEIGINGLYTHIRKNS
jgi:hypothetical protein